MKKKFDAKGKRDPQREDARSETFLKNLKKSWRV